jgi:hypothetical protein
VEGAHPAGFERAAEDVLQDEGPEISNMRRAVNRGSTAVEPERGAVQRLEFAFGSGERVKKAHAGGLPESPAPGKSGLRKTPKSKIPHCFRGLLFVA